LPKLTDHENLVKRSGTKNYTVKIQIPKDLRHQYQGKSNIWKSTKTSDLKEAGHMRDNIVSEYKLEFKAYREGGTPEVVKEKINHYRKILTDITREKSLARETDIDNLDIAYEGIRDEAREEIEKLIAPKGVPNVTGTNKNPNHYISEEEYIADRNPELFNKLKEIDDEVTGKELPVTVAIDDWFKTYSKSVNEKIAKQGRREVEYLAENYDKISQVSFDSIRTYIKKLRLKGNKGNRGNDKQTILKKFNWLRNYWNYLQDEQIIPRTTRHLMGKKFVWETPFDGHKIDTIHSDYTDVLHYEPDEMLKIWRWIRENQSHEQLEIVTALMFTGARVSELINYAKDESIMEDDNKYRYIMIQKGKTARARRQVPIHPLLQPLIDTLKLKGYFKLKQKDVSTRFATARKACGFLDNEELNTKYDMHSIRHTVITLMDRKRISEDTIEQIVGQKPKTIMRKHYSGGVLIEDKQQAINTVQYPFTEEELQFVQNGLK
jgi:hypothetical protein